jgi:hypothetical protein
MPFFNSAISNAPCRGVLQRAKRSLEERRDRSDVAALLSYITEFQTDDGENACNVPIKKMILWLVDNAR